MKSRLKLSYSVSVSGTSHLPIIVGMLYNWFIVIMAIYHKSLQSVKTLEKANLVLGVFTLLAVIVGGLWGFYQFKLAGKADWIAEISVETRVIPYRNNLYLLVVHIKSKNPRNIMFNLKKSKGDSFILKVREIGLDNKEGAVIGEDEGTPMKTIDILGYSGGEYEFLPGAEFDDMETIVLPSKKIIELTAEMDIHNGKKGANGKPDTDFVSASTVVQIKP